MNVAAPAVAVARRRPVLDANDWGVRVALVFFGVFFLVALMVPLSAR